MLENSNEDAAILLIDDDPIFRAEIADVLESEKFKFATFESGAHAIRHMQQRPWSWVPRLVITDIVMDGIGGYQLMRRVNELYPGKNIPIIVVSRLSSADYVYEAEVAGALKFLQKPVPRETLVEVVQKCLTRITPS